MHYFTLDQLRITTETGGLLSVSIIGQGGVFHIEAETRRGNVALVKTRGKVLREFRDVTKAMYLLRGLGIREARIDTKNWRPDQLDIGRASRPDRSKVMREAHEAGEIKRTLDARIAEADSAHAVFHEHDQLFSELENQYAN